MHQEIRAITDATTTCGLLAYGEPTHREPGFGWARNDLFAQLVDHGFSSIALETDRVAALTVNDFVQDGVGTLDAAMREGFSHGFGDLDANRHLVSWMRAYNEDRPPEERLAFHGIDAPLEMLSAASPRRDLEYARDYLGLGLDLADLVGDDERWSRTEAVMDPSESPGDTAEAEKLRAIADDMLTLLYARAPALIAATSRAAWHRARTHLTSARGLLRYHRQAAERAEDSVRWSRLSATRDALMAENLLDIRDLEARRGPTMVFAHNLHLRHNPSTMSMGDMDVSWFGVGAIIASLLGEQYAFVAGSLGRSDAIDLPEPEPETYEGFLQRRSTGAWGLTAAAEVVAGTAAGPASTRTDTSPEQGYFPLDRETLATADAILHISVGAARGTPTWGEQPGPSAQEAESSA